MISRLSKNMFFSLSTVCQFWSFSNLLTKEKTILLDSLSLRENLCNGHYKQQHNNNDKKKAKTSSTIARVFSRTRVFKGEKIIYIRHISLLSKLQNLLLLNYRQKMLLLLHCVLHNFHKVH